MIGFAFPKWGLSICFALAALALLEHPAFANPPEVNKVLARMVALEARVAALEAKNREYQHAVKDARAQARLANDKLRKLSNPTFAIETNVQPIPSLRSYPPTETTMVRSGPFWGASAGGAATRSQVTSRERYTSSVPGNAVPFNVIGEDMLGSSRPTNRGGAMLDVFAGWNTRISDRFVVGGQLEATASSLNFSANGLKNYSYFDSNGLTGQTAIGDFRPQVVSQWMASALLRAGVLLDDHTLLYGIGGWTLAQFESRNVTDNPFFQPTESFLSEGWTVGAGIERKLSANWSIRAEYRYTDFGNHRSQDQFNWRSSGTFNGTQTDQRLTQYDQSMQTGRIGFAYAFGFFQ
jgi:opacity protein-like surface antigen